MGQVLVLELMSPVIALFVSSNKIDLVPLNMWYSEYIKMWYSEYINMWYSEYINMWYSEYINNGNSEEKVETNLCSFKT